MKPASFDYHAPTTAEEAVTILGELGDEAKVLAGGQSLIPMLALRLAVFEHLVDIGRIDELKGVARQNGSVSVGATTTEAAVESNLDIATSVPLLARATPLIGHFQIRNRGTVGGSIAHADPAAEYPAVALALDAEMETTSRRGRRTIPAADFFTGLWATAMEPDELLVATRFPVWSGRCGFAIEEFARRHGDFAIAGAVVAVQLSADDRVVKGAIGLIGLGPTPLRAGTAEKAVVNAVASEISPHDIGRLATSDLTEVPSDLQGEAAYRVRVGSEMVTRAWTAAIGEATHG